MVGRRWAIHLGCFNSCGQHHVADLGFYGVSRKAGGRVVPHFQVVLGGQWSENGGAYGLPMGAVPSKNIPDVVDRLTSHYIRERDGDESFQNFIRRVGKIAIKTLLADLMPIASYAERPDLYSDWGDAREYTIDDLGIGECAGEIVSLVDFGLADAERVVFEAQVALDESKSDLAGEQAYRSMLAAAKGLVQIEWPMVGDDPATIVRELRSRFHDTGKIHDPFAGDKFVNYLFHAHDEAQGGAARFDREAARRRIEEAQLFIEAAHACNARLTQS